MPRSLWERAAGWMTLKCSNTMLLELARVLVDEIVYPSEVEVNEAKGWRFQFEKVDAYHRQHENLFKIEVQPSACLKYGATVEDAVKADATEGVPRQPAEEAGP